MTTKAAIALIMKAMDFVDDALGALDVESLDDETRAELLAKRDKVNDKWAALAPGAQS